MRVDQEKIKAVLSQVKIGSRIIQHGWLPIFNGGFEICSICTVTGLETEQECEFLKGYAVITVKPDRHVPMLDEWNNTWKYSVGVVCDSNDDQYPDSWGGYDEWGESADPKAWIEVLVPGEPEVVRPETLAIWEAKWASIAAEEALDEQRQLEMTRDVPRMNDEIGHVYYKASLGNRVFPVVLKVEIGRQGLAASREFMAEILRHMYMLDELPEYIALERALVERWCEFRNLEVVTVDLEGYRKAERKAIIG